MQTAVHVEPSTRLKPPTRTTHLTRIIRFRFHTFLTRHGTARPAYIAVPVTVSPATVRKPSEPARTVLSRPNGHLYLQHCVEVLYAEFWCMVWSESPSRVILFSTELSETVFASFDLLVLCAFFWFTSLNDCLDLVFEYCFFLVSFFFSRVTPSRMFLVLMLHYFVYYCLSCFLIFLSLLSQLFQELIWVSCWI